MFERKHFNSYSFILKESLVKCKGAVRMGFMNNFSRYYFLIILFSFPYLLFATVPTDVSEERLVCGDPRRNCFSVCLGGKGTFTIWTKYGRNGIQTVFAESKGIWYSANWDEFSGVRDIEIAVPLDVALVNQLEKLREVSRQRERLEDELRSVRRSRSVSRGSTSCRNPFKLPDNSSQDSGGRLRGDPSPTGTLLVELPKEMCALPSTGGNPGCLPSPSNTVLERGQGSDEASPLPGNPSDPNGISPYTEAGAPVNPRALLRPQAPPDTPSEVIEKLGDIDWKLMGNDLKDLVLKYKKTTLLFNFSVAIIIASIHDFQASIKSLPKSKREQVIEFYEYFKDSFIKAVFKPKMSFKKRKLFSLLLWALLASEGGVVMRELLP